MWRVGCLVVVLLAAGCGRIGYDPLAPTSGPDELDGFSLSPPGALFYGKDLAVERTTEGNFVIVWSEFPPASADLQLMFALLSPGGAIVVAPHPIVMLQGELHRVSVGSTASGGYGVGVWSGDDPDDRILELDASGNLVREYPGTGNHSDVAFATRTDRVAIAHRTDYVIGVDIRALDGTVLGTIDPLAPSANQQISPNIFSTPAGFAVLWRESSRIRLATIDPAGAVITPAATFDDTGATQADPTAHPDGMGLVVAWHEGAMSRAQLSGADRWPTAAEVAPVPLREEPTMDVAASDAGEIAVAFETDTVLYPQIAIARTERTAGGTGPWDVVAVTDPTMHTCCPRIAAGRDGYVVVYCAAVESTLALYVAFVGDP